MSWESLGEITVTPDNTSVIVGSFSIEEGDDTIWVEVQRIGAPGPWPWSYGVLTWQTQFGNELGSQKAYTADAGEVFRLGVGRTPRSRDGSIIYRPRSFNLAWVKNGNPLRLVFSATSGVTAAIPEPLSGGGIAFPVVDGSWLYQQDTGLLRLKL